MRLIFLTAVALIFLGPLLALFLQAPLSQFTSVIAEPAISKSIFVTLVSGAAGAIFSLVFGIIFARQFALFSWKWKRAQKLLLLIPYLIPNFILASAFVIAWNPGSGVLNPFFEFPLYGLFGMTLLLGISHIPVALLVLEEKFRRIDPSWREAARLSGAGALRILFQIELPLLLPSLISVFSLCFALNVSAFAIPAWIGAPAKVYPLTYKIFQAIQVGGIEGIPDGALLSILLFLCAFPTFLLGILAQRKEARFVTVSAKAAKASFEAQGKKSFFLFQVFFWVSQFLFWIAPVGVLFVSTLVAPGCLQEHGLACLNESSLNAYRYVLFDLDDTRVSFLNSLYYGSIASVTILCLSVASLVLFASSKALQRSAEWTFAIPVSTPGAIIALALIVSLSGNYYINLYNTPWILVFAFVIKHTSLAFSPLRTGFANISTALLEAAQLAGAKRHQIWKKIVLPILAPEVLGGFFLVMIPILGELTMSVFLSSPVFRPVGVVLFELQDYADQVSAGALSIVLIISILVLNFLARFVSRGRIGY